MPQTPFPSPERRGGAARRPRPVDEDEEDEDRPTRLRTPGGGARYGDASGAERPQTARWPALAPDAGAAAMVERFRLVVQEEAEALPATLGPNSRQFPHETVLTALKTHMRESGLQKESDYASGGTLAPIIIQRPALRRVLSAAACTGRPGPWLRVHRAHNLSAG